MSEKKGDKKGRSVLVSGVVICTVAAIIGSLTIRDCQHSKLERL